MKKSTIYGILSLLLWLGCVVWIIFAYGWQLAVILFILKWSYAVSDLSDSEKSKE